MKFHMLNDEVPVPTKAYAGDAGYDLYSPRYIALTPLKTTRIALGFTVDIPPGHVALMLPRSSLGIKGVIVNSNVIDEGYKGELTVVLQLIRPPSDGPHVIHKGDRVAQLVVLPRYVDPHEDKLLPRHIQAFGSTGP